MADEARNPSETVPGGAYLVNNRWVNANGEPVEDPTPKPVKAEKPADTKPATADKKDA